MTARRNKSKTPTAVLAMRGSWRAQARKKTEPAPPVGLPEQPDWLTSLDVPTTQQIWDRVVSDLDLIGTLAQTDGGSIGRYCVVLRQWLLAKAFVEKHGEALPVKDKDGKITGFVALPQALSFKHLLQELLKLEREFGMTPSSRAGLAITPRKVDEDLERVYFG